MDPFFPPSLLEPSRSRGQIRRYIHMLFHYGSGVLVKTRTRQIVLHAQKTFNLRHGISPDAFFFLFFFFTQGGFCAADNIPYSAHWIPHFQRLTLFLLRTLAFTFTYHFSTSTKSNDACLPMSNVHFNVNSAKPCILCNTTRPRGCFPASPGLCVTSAPHPTVLFRVPGWCRWLRPAPERKK